MGGSLPFRSGVVVSLRPLSVCHGSLWLVTALFTCLSLSLPVPFFSWLLLLLRQVPWVCGLTFPVVVRTLAVGTGFLMLPACPSPSFGLLVYWFLWLLFSTWVPYLRDGVTPAGSRIVCPRSERRFSLSIWVRCTGQFLAGPPASVCGFLRALFLRVCCQVVLLLSLALSRVLHCPLLGFSVTSPTLARGLGLSFVPSFAPCSCWCPLSGYPSLRLRVLGDSWFSPLCSPDCRSASRFTYPDLPPVCRLSFRLGDFSFG